MKLRQKSKRDQALDAVASMAKTWSEWRLGEKVSKTASKAGRKASSKRGKKGSGSEGGKRKRVRIAGAVAVVGGIGAAVAKKLTGGKAEPLYTPPAPAPEMPPPAPVVADQAGDAPPQPGSDDPPAAATPAADEPLGSEDATASADADDDQSSSDLAPEPADLVSDTAADDAESGDDAADRSG